MSRSAVQASGESPATAGAPLRIDVTNRCVWRSGRRLMLSPKGFELLRFLAANQGDLVSSEELLSHLWPDTFVQPENLKKYVLEIRKALGDDARQPQYIETLPRRGYRLICTIDAIAPAATPEEPAAAVHRLIGRDEPLKKLNAHLQKALTGEAQVVFVTGDVGIGKTALVDAFHSQALKGVRSGGRFLRGQCIEGHGDQEPYYAILEALSDYCRSEPDGSALAVLAENAPTWLMQFPSLIAVLPKEIRATMDREREVTSRQRMLREICAALEVMSAQQPLVLVVEDLHWSDPSTIDFFEAMARRRSHSRLLLIGTYRPIDVVVAEHPLKTLKRDLLLRSLCHEVALSALPLNEGAAYLAAIAGAPRPPDKLVQVVYSHSEGNPLFMAAALDYVLNQKLVAAHESGWQLHTSPEVIQAAIPDGLRELVDLRLRRLSAEERAILEVASVAGVTFAASEVAAALNADADVVENQLERLTQLHQICRYASRATVEDASDGVFEFSHAVYREVFYRSLSPSQKRQFHAKIAVQLEKQSGARASESASRLAFHFERAGDWARSVHYLVIAAERAAAMHAPAEAVAGLRQALALAGKLGGSPISTEIEVLERLSSVEGAYGRGASAEEWGRLMLEKAKLSGSADAQLRALLRLVRVKGWSNTGSFAEPLQQAEALRGVSVRPLLLEMRVEGNFWRLASGWCESAAAEGESAFLDLRNQADSCTVARCAVMYSQFLQFRSCYERSRDLLSSALPVLRETFDVSIFNLALHLIENSLFYLGEWGELRRSNGAMQTLAQKIGNRGTWIGAAMSRSWLCLECFDFAQVKSICAEVLDPNGEPPSILVRMPAQILAGWAEHGLGRPAHGIALLEDALDLSRRNPGYFGWYYRAPLHLGVAEARFATGDLQNAEAELERLKELVMAGPERTWQVRALEFSMRLAMAKGDRRTARQNLERAFAVQEGFDLPLAAWRLHATAAVVLQRTGESRLAKEQQTRRLEAIQRLAASLDTDDPLRTSFLRAALSEH